MIAGRTSPVVHFEAVEQRSSTPLLFGHVPELPVNNSVEILYRGRSREGV